MEIGQLEQKLMNVTNVDTDGQRRTTHDDDSNWSPTSKDLKQLRFWVLTLFVLLYLGNGKSHVKTADTLPKGISIRNPKKKTTSSYN